MTSQLTHMRVVNGQSKCEDCALKNPNYGLEHERKLRWCGACARVHGAVHHRKWCGATLASDDLSRFWPIDKGQTEAFKPLALDDATEEQLIERLATVQSREPNVLGSLLLGQPGVASRRSSPSKRLGEGDNDDDGSAKKQQRVQ